MNATLAHLLHFVFNPFLSSLVAQNLKLSVWYMYVFSFSERVLHHSRCILNVAVGICWKMPASSGIFRHILLVNITEDLPEDAGIFQKIPENANISLQICTFLLNFQYEYVHIRKIADTNMYIYVK